MSWWSINQASGCANLTTNVLRHIWKSHCLVVKVSSNETKRWWYLGGLRARDGKGHGTPANPRLTTYPSDTWRLRGRIRKCMRKTVAQWSWRSPVRLAYRVRVQSNNASPFFVFFTKEGKWNLRHFVGVGLSRHWMPFRCVECLLDSYSPNERGWQYAIEART